MKKLGLCLSGGGARGAYQVGAIKALDELGIYDKIKCISGASIGSVNAALLANNSIETVKDLWFTIPEDPIGRSNSIIERIKEEKEHIFEAGLYSIHLLEHLLDGKICFNQVTDKDVYVSLSESGDEDDIAILELFRSSVDHYLRHHSKSKYILLNSLDESDIQTVIKASCSIPIVFSPIIINDKKYYDGGVFDNSPIQPLIDAGCDEIIFINISIIGTYHKYRKAFPHITMHEIKGHKLGSILDFTNAHSDKLYQMGYEDAMNYFKDKNL